MSKKDYIEFAKMFNRLLNDPDMPKDIVETIMDETMDVLANDNPNFDYGRFRDYAHKEITQ